MKFLVLILIFSILGVYNLYSTDVTISWTAVDKYIDASPINKNIDLKYDVFRSTRADLVNPLKLNTPTNLIIKTNNTYILIDKSFIKGRNYYYFITVGNVGLTQNSDVIMIKYITTK